LNPDTAPYRRRVLDTELDRLISAGARALVVEGAKAVGKSVTAARRVDRAYMLEDRAVRELVAANPAAAIGAGSVLIDEWQRVPPAWDAVRRAVDAQALTGAVFLTGSAGQANPGTHSGAGRMVTLHLRPFTLFERDLAEPTVSLSELLSGDRPALAGETTVALSDYVSEIVAGGFPGIRATSEPLRRSLLRGYVDRVIDRDFAELGRSIRNPQALRRWMAAYSAATSTSTSFETIRDAATAGHADKPARLTTQPYRDALERLYILDPVPAWSPSNSHISELAGAPKHHLVDTSLVTSMLGLDAAALLRGEQGGVPTPHGDPILGALFESLVTQSVRVYAQAAEASIGHLRTHRGSHEVDLIVERPDGKVVAVEVKLAGAIDDSDIRHLHWLADRIGSQLLDAVVISTGPYAYRRADGIAVVPAALLGP
jgi:uncharacterized protein